VLCDFYDRTSDDPKIIEESQGIKQAIELDILRGEYRWSQIFRKDELHTGRRVLLAYGLQFMNQMGGINIVVVCEAGSSILSSIFFYFLLFIVGAWKLTEYQTYVTTGKN
jgi:hypothetical protein